MKLRNVIGAMVVVAGLATLSAPAISAELREPHAHLIVDVPNDWKIGTEGDYAIAFPKDESFHLRVVGTDRGRQQEDAAERWLSTFLARHLDAVTIDEKAKRVEHGNYIGAEIYGHGKEHGGAPAKWFALYLVDKNQPSKGVVVLGTGTIAGYEMHWRGIRESLKTLRTY